MKLGRLLTASVIILLMLTACAPVDSCTADPNLPECDTRRAGAQATVAAIDADRAVVDRLAAQQAHTDELAVHAKETQAFISIKSTLWLFSPSFCMRAEHLIEIQYIVGY